MNNLTGLVVILLLFSVALNYPPVSSSQVSHKEPEILIFRLQQTFKVGLLQPSSVTVYEYYNPGRKTHPDHHSSHHITAELRISPREFIKTSPGTFYYILSLDIQI